MQKDPCFCCTTEASLFLASELPGLPDSFQLPWPPVQNVVIFNMLDDAYYEVKTPTGPGGLAGPLRVDLQQRWGWPVLQEWAPFRLCSVALTSAGSCAASDLSRLDRPAGMHNERLAPCVQLPEIEMHPPAAWSLARPASAGMHQPWCTLSSVVLPVLQQ